MTYQRIQALAIVGLCLMGLVACQQRSVDAQNPKSSKAAAPAGSTAAAATPAAAPAYETAVRQSAKDFAAAFDKGDAKAIAALWTEDGEFIDEAGTRIVGREAIEKRYQEFFAQNAGATIEIVIDALRGAGADTALEDGRAAVTLPSHAGASSSGKYTAVHVRRDGKWALASVRDLPGESANEPSLADLDWMIGTWHAEHLGKEMTITCRWLADKSFVEATYARLEGGKPVTTATQIIGVDPRSGRITSWMFNADKGFAQGTWVPHETGWAIGFEGVRADGTQTTAINLLARVNDALVWKSTHRTIGGQPLPDTEEVVLKRK
jgi:uncharacterized protein (TIGR02246 family)